MPNLDRERIARELYLGLAAARMKPGDRVSLVLACGSGVTVRRLDERKMEVTLVRAQEDVFLLDTTAADYPDSLAQILGAE